MLVRTPGHSLPREESHDDSDEWPTDENRHQDRDAITDVLQETRDEVALTRLGPRGHEGRDTDADQTGCDLLQTLPAHQSPQRDCGTGPESAPHGDTELIARHQIGNDENHGGGAAVDHSAPAAEGTVQEYALLAYVGARLRLNHGLRGVPGTARW